MEMEPLVTLARKEYLLKKEELNYGKTLVHIRRELFSKIHSKELTYKLCTEIAPRFIERAGGYLRIVRTHIRFDSATIASVSFV
jgi:large subunit ribosomal protein L17